MIKSIFKSFLSYFFSGLLYTVPFAITLYVIVQIFIFIDGLVPVDVPGLGVLVLVIFIAIMGYLGSSIIAQPIMDYFSRLLNRIPLLKTIYTSIKDLLSAFVGKKKKFNQPVLVKVNKDSNLEKLGFITGTDLGVLNIKEGKVAVYLPHSYAFSGNLFIVSTENITPIDKNAVDVMKFILSGGVAELEADDKKPTEEMR